MIHCYFGLPGCGKTTLLAKIAVQAQRQIDRGLSRYSYVYTNTEISYPGIRLIRWEALGVYDIKNALILIDEATLFADSRRYKSFPQEKIEWFMTHRHEFCDLVYFAQFFDAVDKRMRMVTDRVFYVKKIYFTGLTYYVRIPKSIIIPEQTGDIIEGYRMPNFFEKLFLMKIIRRRRWYKYFDSWHHYTQRPPLLDASDCTSEEELIRLCGLDPKKEKKLPKTERARLMFVCSGKPAPIDTFILRYVTTPTKKTVAYFSGLIRKIKG